MGYIDDSKMRTPHYTGTLPSSAVVTRRPPDVLLDLATATLERNLTCGEPSTEVAAAREILGFLLHFTIMQDRDGGEDYTFDDDLLGN